MKHTPKRHKASNTFKVSIRLVLSYVIFLINLTEFYKFVFASDNFCFQFQSFSERISQIEVNVFHKVKHPYEEEDEENGTFYSRCLKRLKNDNFSAEFTELCKVLPHDVSLPELIVQKQKLVDILISHVKSCDLEALPPALE